MHEGLGIIEIHRHRPMQPASNQGQGDPRSTCSGTSASPPTSSAFDELLEEEPILAKGAGVGQAALLSPRTGTPWLLWACV